MATISSKLSSDYDSRADLFVSQLSVGSSTYALAVERGIRFFDGSTDSEGKLWTGATEFSVIIPTVADIVTDPVRLVGTVGSDGELPSGLTPSKGDLVYITADCSFQGVACEAGDMAIYDGATTNPAWHVISGENQVSIKAGVDPSSVAANVTSVKLGTTAKTVLDVEGKELALSVPGVTQVKNVAASISAEGQVTIASKPIFLTQASDTIKTIGETATFSLPTALANGAVDFGDTRVLVSDNITLSGGAWPGVSKNEAVTISGTTAATLSVDATGSDFVSSVTAIKAATLVTTDNNSDIAYVTGLSATDGSDFVSGIHAYTAEDASKTPVFTLTTYAAAAASNTFATGFGAAGESGDVLSSVSVGSVSLDAAGSGILTGLSKGGNSVLIDASVSTNASEWFVTGLADNASAVTSVSFGTVEVTPQTSAAVVSASVSDHVLSFTTGNFMTSATAALSDTGVTTKAFTKGGVALNLSTDSFATASLLQAATTFSYKSLVSSAVDLTATSTSYYLDLSKDHAYTATTGHLSINSTNADVLTASYSIANGTVSATIPANTFAISLSNNGSFPALSFAAPSGTLSGSVATALASSDYEVLQLTSATIALPGAYSISTDASDAAAAGAPTVAIASTYALENGYVSFESNTFVTDVLFDGTTAPNANA